MAAIPQTPKNPDTQPIRTSQRGETVLIMGSFVPAGTGTTAPTGVVGRDFTVTQTADGVFKVSLKFPFKQTIAFVPSVGVAAETTDIYAQGGDIVAATATAGESRGIRTMTGGTPTNISGDAAPSVHFFWLVKRF